MNLTVFLKGYMSHRRKLLLLAIGCVLLLIVAPVFPFQDDLMYLTSPNIEFTWGDVLPGISFWRPFDALWGCALGFLPWLFPWANKVAVVVGHIVCVGVIWRLVDMLCNDINHNARLFAVGFFALSSGIVATLFNTDSLNIVWSCVWGALGTLVLLEGRAFRLVLLCYGTSILFKESGVSWLAVGPLLMFARDGSWHRLFKGLVIGAALLLIYMGIRFLLRGEVVLGGNGDYALTFLPQIIVKNLTILTGMALSNIDWLAYFTGKYILFLVTVILSVSAWLLYAFATDFMHSKIVKRRLFVSVVILLALAAPHCFFKNHHPAEMHLYPVLIGCALSIALIPVSDKMRRFFYLAAVAIGLVFAIGWVDKVGEVYRHSFRTLALLNEIKASVKDFDSASKYFVERDPTIRRYSVFTQPPGWGLDYGRGLRCLNGWRESKVVIVEE